jgi:hypothetical protein
MDLRLILGGGTAVAGPPRQSVGPPVEDKTRDRDFSKLLSLIQSGGETHGEEVAVEPNAQPQNLDSVEKSEEISSSVLALAAVSLPVPNLPTQVTPTALESSAITSKPELLASVQDGVVDQNAVQSLPGLSNGFARSNRPGTNSMIGNGLMRIRPGATPSNGEPKLDLRFAEPLGRPLQAIEMPRPGQTPQDLMIMAQDLGLNPSGVVATNIADPSMIELTGNQVFIEMPKPGQLSNPLDPGASEDGIGTGAVESTTLPAPTSAENQPGMTGQGQEQGQGQSNSQNANGSGAVQNEQTGRIDNAKGLSPRERAEAVRQVQKGMERINLRNSRESIQIRLEPEQLGSVMIELQRGSEGLTAMLQASNEPLREALHQSRSELAASMAAKGVQDVKVTVQAPTESPNSQSSTGNSNQQSNQQGQNQQAREQSRPHAQDNFLRQFSFHSNRLENNSNQFWRKRSTTRLDIES